MGNEVAKIGPSEEPNSRRRTVIATETSVKMSKGQQHRFMWYYPNWESYLDDADNVYYYNDVLKETIWDPAEIYGGPPRSEGIPEDIEWLSSTPAPTLGATGRTPSRTTSMTDYHAKRAMQIEERKETLQQDSFAHWKELAKIGHVDPDVIEDHVAESQAVVSEVSQGLFEAELLYKLPWAYKVLQLGEAVRDSYLQIGDMFDSSKYDNCNDVPRYDDGGLVSWWNDLEDLHFSVTAVIDSGVVGLESEHYTEEMKKLQAIAATGNEDDMLEGFLARKIEVEKELDGLRARCFAVVSMDNGPSREQLDNIYRYLKDNVDGDTNLDDLQDEMEEVVSSTLKQQHRFMVDVVLMMGLLEDEEERLEKRIKSFKGKARRLNDAGEEVEGEDEEGEGEGAEKSYSNDEEGYNGYYDEEGTWVEGVPGYSYEDYYYSEGAVEDGTEATGATTGFTMTMKDAALLHDKQLVQSKVAEQEAESLRLAEELQHQKDSRAKALQERLAKKKADRAKQLAEEGVDGEEAMAKVELELAEEEAIEIDEMDKMVTAALKTRDSETKQKLNDVCDEEAARINNEAEEERTEKIEGLRQTLEEEKAQRIAEVMAERGCSETEATALVEDEIEQKEDEAMRQIDKEILERAEKRRQAVVESIREQHTKSAGALEQELAVQKERKVKALKQRLEKKKELKAAELMNSGVTAREAVEMADVEIKDTMAVELKKVEEEAQAQIDEVQQRTVAAIKEAQERESARLEQDLLVQESRHKKSLHERLQKREKKREQTLKAEGLSADDAKKIAEEENKTAKAEALKALEEEIQQIKITQEAEAQKLEAYHATKKESTQKSLKDRLAKKKAKKEAELSPAEKLEQFLSTVREKQKKDLAKLTSFIEYEKKRSLDAAERRDALELGNTAMQTAMLFATVKESMITGYKKQCVYQVRAIKDINDARELTSSEHAAAMKTASEQLIIRHARDQKGVWDSQIAEQSKARAKMQEDCTPIEKVIEMEEKYHRRNVDSVRKQQTQLLLTLVGVYLNVSFLQDNAAGAGVTQKEDIDDDEDDIFGDMGSVESFSAEASQWFDGCLGLHSVYDKTPEALLSKFQHVMLQIKQAQGEATPTDVGPAGAVFYQVTLIVLKALCEAFQTQICVSSTVASHSSADGNSIKNAIKASVQVYQADLSLEAAFNSLEARKYVQTQFKTALDEFLDDPVQPTLFFLEALQNMKTQTVPSGTESVKTNKRIVDEATERKNRMLKSIDGKVDRKRKDIREKFRKRTDAKIHECKEARTDIPDDFASQEEAALKTELDNLESALEEVKEIVESNVQSLHTISVDGLMYALEKKLKGDVLETTDLKQLEAEAEKEAEKNEAKKLMKAQKEEAEKLDVMLKVQRAREQQALQKRLLARRAKTKA